MKINNFKAFAIFALLVFASLPTQSHAYEVTDRHMIRLSDTLTMYTLSYEFGFLNADAWMPLVASRTSTSTMNGNQTTSIILSDAKLDNYKYHVPMKKNENFTLVILEQHAIGKSKNSVTVDKLPITIQKKGEKMMLWTLQGEELKDFTIPKKK